MYDDYVYVDECIAEQLNTDDSRTSRDKRGITLLLNAWLDITFIIKNSEANREVWHKISAWLYLQ